MTKNAARFGRTRWVSLVLLVVLLTATLGRRVRLRVRGGTQTRQLLRERTAEAGLSLSSAVSSSKPTLLVLGATYAADPTHAVAKALTQTFAGAAGTAVAIVQVH